MKKSLFTLSLIALFGFGLASCNKCVTCGSCPDGVTISDDAGNEVAEKEICEDDAASKEDYDAGIAIIEGIGCTCK